MVKVNVDQISSAMKERYNIRNMSVIAHEDHGKTTLMDSLISSAGIIPEYRSVYPGCWLPPREDEIARGITIKASSALQFQVAAGVDLPANSSSSQFLINLIDLPGHVDLSSEVTAALRVTDGALVVVDTVEGVCVQTESVLRQAILESVVPILFVNKMDRLFLELKMEPEDAYIKLRSTIESVNALVQVAEGSPSCVHLQPQTGNVGFGSGYQGWGFTIEAWARIYEAALGVSHAKMINNLWGDRFYDSVTKKWSDNPVSEDGRTLERGFCKFIYTPLRDLIVAVNDGDRAKVDAKLMVLNITLSPNEMELTGRDLIRAIMKKFLPADECILTMMVQHIPSPVVAQRYRAEQFYTGPQDDECGVAMAECNPDGPVMVYISKMIPNSSGHFIAFGRVFSGTVTPGMTIRILQPEYDPVTKPTLVSSKRITNVVLMMGRRQDTVEACPAGNIIGFTGIDSYLVKTGTLTTSAVAHSIAPMKFSVSPVVRAAVFPKDASQLPKLIEGIKRLIKTDPAIQHFRSDSENVIAAVGELQLEICLKDLQEIAGCEIISSQPVVSYRETVTIESQVCLSTSANKHNRLYIKCAPLNPTLANDIDSKTIDPMSNDILNRVQQFAQYDWAPAETRSIWAFGPDGNGANVFVNQTTGAQYLNEARDLLVDGFDAATSTGVLCGEELRGVHFSLMDVTLIADGAHRRCGQLTPAAHRAFCSAQLCGVPRLVEPMYLAEVVVPNRMMSVVNRCIASRRGILVSSKEKSGMNGIYVIRAHLPVAQSFGFLNLLKTETSGQAFLQMTFDHWALLDQDPLDPKTDAYRIVREIRARKGLPVDVPPLTEYLDRL
ncbi:hypothetical protein SAMD00019534_099310 [Acytostelium subglobosum LB1]|uniref:hypothetical protein n=1 Tax=Acytostelium subglobosum LB1 TaxID=1410327 RepID=UPI000644E962|nr:hypothetical protein SAMD00019534_099310 [Acytostelium subglobosum LB1]GAM26756.1 hypothetical protein SAMD00019534_099310 [Acytostelium subglobosum LB1]|eukprot:XP_012750417.1 hypothetical protein SAMD00019534_099310 [Acytostelium subglobosum LB1]